MKSGISLPRKNDFYHVTSGQQAEGMEVGDYKRRTTTDVFSVFISVTVRKQTRLWCTYYCAESLSWNSLERLKQAWTPLSAHIRFMQSPSSVVISPSSSELAREKSCLASSWPGKQWFIVSDEKQNWIFNRHNKRANYAVFCSSLPSYATAKRLFQLFVRLGFRLPFKTLP